MTKNDKWRLAGLALVAVAAAVLSLLAAGCGRSGEPEATAAATKAQFIKTGDKICDKANVAQEQRLAVLSLKFSGKRRQITDETRILFAGLPPLRQEVKELKELEPSEDQQAEAIVEALEKAIQKTEADPTSLLKEGASPFTNAEKQARAYGFVVCGAP